jgi:hypothetical protein
LSGVPVVDWPLCAIHCLCAAISVLVAGRPSLTHLPASNYTPSGAVAVAGGLVSIECVVSPGTGAAGSGDAICAMAAVAASVAAIAAAMLIFIPSSSVRIA